MYGGSHYIISAAADLTPQGRAILEASKKFGDGKTDRGNHVIVVCCLLTYRCSSIVSSYHFAFR
jgi:hypothetical protein